MLIGRQWRHENSHFTFPDVLTLSYLLVDSVAGYSLESYCQNKRTYSAHDCPEAI